MAFFDRWLGNYGTWNAFWRRLTFQHYDPGALELALNERLEGSEYDPRLKQRQGVVIFERMSREDSRLATALNLLKEPILACTWTVEASDDNVKRFVEDNIGLSDRPTTRVEWMQILKEMLRAQELGFCIHEITYRLQNEMEHFHAVSHRPQLSIERFEDDGDYLTGLYQIKEFKPEKRLEFLSAKRLMYTAYNRIGTDFWGRSIIRPAYRDWYFKEILLIISMINAKRYGVPVPHAQHAPGVSKKARQQVFKAMQEMSLDQRSAMVTGSQSKDNPDWTFGFFEPERSRQMENLPLLNYFDDNLAKVCLVLFLDLGSVSSGNRALGDTFADILYNSLEARCDTTADTVNKQLLPGLVEKNFGMNAWARMSWANLELHNMERFVEAFARLAEVYPIPLTVEDQERFRGVLQMPPTPEGATELEPDRAGTPENMPGVGSSSGNAST